MGQLIVRRLEDDVKQRLQRRAVRHGVSMEEEIRSILRNAVAADDRPRLGLGSEIAALFRDVEDQDKPLPEIPDEPVDSVRFDE